MKNKELVQLIEDRNREYALTGARRRLGRTGSKNILVARLKEDDAERNPEVTFTAEQTIGDAGEGLGDDDAAADADGEDCVSTESEYIIPEDLGNVDKDASVASKAGSDEDSIPIAEGAGEGIGKFQNLFCPISF